MARWFWPPEEHGWWRGHDYWFAVFIAGLVAAAIVALVGYPWWGLLVAAPLLAFGMYVAREDLNHPGG
jgi:hypothetical protein